MTNCQLQPTFAGWNNSGSPMQFSAQPNYAPSTSYFQPHQPVSNYSQQHAQPNCSQQHSQANHSPQHAQPKCSQQHAQPNCSQQHAQPNYSQQHAQPSYSQQRAQPNHPQQRDQNLQQPDPMMSQSDVDAVLKSMKNFVCPRGCFPQGMVDSMTYNPHNSINNTRNPERNADHKQNGTYNQSSMANNHITQNSNTPQKKHNFSQDGQCSNNYSPQINHNHIPHNHIHQGHQESHAQCFHKNPQNREYLAHVPGYIKSQPPVQEAQHRTSAHAQQYEPHVSALQHLHDTQGHEVHRCAKTHGNMYGEGNVYLNSKSEDMFPVICKGQLDELQPANFIKNGLRVEKTDGLQGTRSKSGPPPKGWLIGPSTPKSRSRRSYC